MKNNNINIHYLSIYHPIAVNTNAFLTYLSDKKNYTSEIIRKDGKLYVRISTTLDNINDILCHCDGRSLSSNYPTLKDGTTFYRIEQDIPCDSNEDAKRVKEGFNKWYCGAYATLLSKLLEDSKELYSDFNFFLHLVEHR